MSEGEEAISLSEESEGDGPNIRPPQHSSASAVGKHKQKKRKRSRSKHSDRRNNDDRSRDRKKSSRDYDRERNRNRGRNDIDVRRDRGPQDSRHIREPYDRSDRDRDRYSRSGDRQPYDRPRKRNDEEEERRKRLLMVEKMENERKEIEAKKKTKLLEEEMERLQAALKRKKASKRSPSRSKKHKRKKKKRRHSSSDESAEEMEVDNKDSVSEEESEAGEDDNDDASTEQEDDQEEEEESDSEEDSDSDDESDSTASEKAEDTPEHEENSSEDGELEEEGEEEKKLEELAAKVDKKASGKDIEKPKEKREVFVKKPEKSPTTMGGKWDDPKSPNRTPSRSPTPLKEESDRTPGGIGSGRDSRVNSPSGSGGGGDMSAAIGDRDLDLAASPLSIKDELPPYLPSVHGCRNVAEFKCLNKIEEGTYGVVYRAMDLRTNEMVALKKLKMEREKSGFPITSLREVNTLLIAQHPNVVHVREIVVGSIMDHIFIVMDFVQHDLKTLMETLRKKNQVFLPQEVKCLMIQLLRAIAHLHDNWILHRDLKASNLLLSHKGILKVGDFGLAREYGSPLKAYTSVVVTLWYRAPELLLGIKVRFHTEVSCDGSRLCCLCCCPKLDQGNTFLCSSPTLTRCPCVS
eukprot:TRINITY_DN5263_c0_g1_i1.p1 TRINITY_DN5263_c0_g1~~TRINITY_DN5263_c0_g1_i1.p1  ORF type:complete len:645 (-),score=213.78 TRINITY_DN5263_c0_g1_i1:409-2310(-)